MPGTCWAPSATAEFDRGPSGVGEAHRDDPLQALLPHHRQEFLDHLRGAEIRADLR